MENEQEWINKIVVDSLNMTKAYHMQRVAEIDAALMHFTPTTVSQTQQSTTKTKRGRKRTTWHDFEDNFLREEHQKNPTVANAILADGIFNKFGIRRTPEAISLHRRQLGIGSFKRPRKAKTEASQEQHHDGRGGAVNKWQPEEDASIIEMKKKGMNAEQVSEAMGGKRTSHAIEMRWSGMRKRGELPEKTKEESTNEPEVVINEQAPKEE